MRRVRRLVQVVVASGLLTASHAWAQQAEAEAVTTAEPPVPAKVCQFEDVTGSRMRKRVCLTPTQWEARERAAKEAVRETDARSVGAQHKG